MDGGDHGGYTGGNDGYGANHGGVTDYSFFSNYLNKYQNHPSLYKPAPPPLTAINRFLWGKTQTDYQTQNHEIMMINQSFISPNVSFLNSGINNENQMPHSSTIVDNIKDMFSNESGECVTWDELKSCPKHDRIQENKPENVVSSGFGKKTKGGNKTSKVFIKGQWTDEEDSKLIRLVNKYGERKWALIAEKMIQRSGKQCRERWRNHLQPDIKKDSWSEQELRMLIEAHQKVGNKWAEIAKLIPGRTENSVKNQWNATKRKQNSSRKNKKNDTKNKKSQSCTLLQDYIRSKTNDHQNLASSSSSSSSSSTTTKTTSTTTTASKSANIVAELANFNTDSDPSLEITQSCDEELNFMETFFKTTNNTTISNESHIEPKSPSIKHPSGFSLFSSCLLDHDHDNVNSNMYLNYYPEDDSSKSQLSLDVNQLEEANTRPGSSDLVCHGDGISSNAEKLWTW